MRADGLTWKGWLIAGAMSLLVVVLVVGRSQALRRPPAFPLRDYGVAPAFQLTDDLERPVNSNDLRGKVVVANFVYTHCTEICPLLSSQMQALQEQLQSARLLGTDVQLLSFTVDPARDTTAVLRAYAAQHHADPVAWRFLTGPEQTVVPLIVEGFHLGVTALPPPTPSMAAGDMSAHDHGSYEVMHSGRFVVIDRQGHIQAYIDGRDFDRARMLQTLKQLAAK